MCLIVKYIHKQQNNGPKMEPLVLLRLYMCSHPDPVFLDGRPGSRRVDVASGRVGGGTAPGGAGAAVADP